MNKILTKKNTLRGFFVCITVSQERQDRVVS